MSTVHKGKEPVNLNICETSFYQKPNLKGHIDPVHEEKKLFKCEICVVTFTTKEIISAHNSFVHAQNKALEHGITDTCFEQKPYQKCNTAQDFKRSDMHQEDICNINFVEKYQMKRYIAGVLEEIELSMKCFES